MITERTTIGLDVHAASIVAAAIDERTGEIHERRFGGEIEPVIEWAGSLPGSVEIAAPGR